MMLKKRIAAVVLVRDSIAVQSVGFKKYLPIGHPKIAIEFLCQWGVDEIVLLDISARRKGMEPNFRMISECSKYCNVPLTVGGGINEISHIHALMHCGADKVSLNRPAIVNTALITEASHVFGSQCIVVSVDVKLTDDGYRVYDYLAGSVIKTTPEEFCDETQSLGAGEILLNSVDRDGMKTGYDVTLINRVSATVTLPVIACGGAGNPGHVRHALARSAASAIAAANFFHFFEHSVTITKASAKNFSPIRHETHALYDDNGADDIGRLLKKPDSLLESLLYERIEKEVI